MHVEESSVLLLAWLHAQHCSSRKTHYLCCSGCSLMLGKKGILIFSAAHCHYLQQESNMKIV